MATFQDFIQSLMQALRAQQLYGPAHPRFSDSLSSIVEAYNGFLEGKAQVQVATRNGRLFLDKALEDLNNLPVKALSALLEEHQIHALLLYPGAEPAELNSLLALLNLKPAQIREQGGAKKYLEDRKVAHVRILATRLEEVSEAGEVMAMLLESVSAPPRLPSGGGPGEGPGTGGPGDKGSPGPEGAIPGAPAKAGAPASGGTAALVAQMRAFFASLVADFDHPADLRRLGPHLQDAGLDRQGAQPTTQGVITQAVTAMEPSQRAGLFRSANLLGSGPLRNLFGRLVGTQGVTTLTSLFNSGGIGPRDLGDVASELKPMSPNPTRWGDQLMDALRREGMTEDQLKELMEVLSWDELSTEAKLSKLLDGQRVFEMPMAKVLAFLRELLEAGRNQDFLRLLRQYAAGLAFPAVARRKAVAQAFEGIADWVDIPGMPPLVMKELMDILSRAYGREKDPDVHSWISQAVEHILWYWVEVGNPKQAHTLWEELQDVVTELSLPATWKNQATTDLLARLGTPERMEKVFAQLFKLDRDSAANQVHPYLAMLGPSAANHLVDRLAEEKDRVRRGRLIEALKFCGQTAETPLLEALASKEWFVVRNALIVLGEVAGQDRLPDVLPFLGNPDLRVLRAAVRTAGRMGGRSAELALVPLLGKKDTETQMEVLFALGEMKAKGAVPALEDLAKAKSRQKPAQDRVREKAIELLGQLGSHSALPTLDALLQRKKGFFSESRELAPIRVTAFRAVLALGGPEARNLTDRILAAEPMGEEREAFKALMNQGS